MASYDKPMDNPINWSFKIGRLFNIDIRLHVMFVLAAFILISMEVASLRKAGISLSFTNTIVNPLGTWAILFFIVLVHEFGHCFGARHAGGEAEEILLWPLGGLALVSPPNTARANLITAVAGPAVNVIICLLTGAILVVWMGSFLAIPINPLAPSMPISSSLHPSTAQMWILRLFGISYLLLLFNLLPMFPLDGGRVFQCIMWQKRGFHDATKLATTVGMAGAVCLGLFGLFTGASFLLLAIAVFGYFECYRMKQMLKMGELQEEGEFGYDFSKGYDAFEQDEAEKKPGALQRWRDKKTAAKAERERLELEKHQQAVEELLAKVSAHGIDSLTAKERSVLQKETDRQSS